MPNLLDILAAARAAPPVAVTGIWIGNGRVRVLSVHDGQLAARRAAAVLKRERFREHPGKVFSGGLQIRQITADVNGNPIKPGSIIQVTRDP